MRRSSASIVATWKPAADLGAGPWTRFWRVTIPLGLPGTLAAFFMVFIPTVGEYVTPTLIGGTEGIMYGNLIQQFFSSLGELGPGLGAGGRHAGGHRDPGDRRAAGGRPPTGDRLMVAASGARKPSPAIGVGRTRLPLRAYFVVLVLLLYLPIGLLFLFSFNSNTFLAFPMQGFTLHWYEEAFADAALLGAARNSVIVGALAASVATAIGFAVSVAVVRFRFRGRAGLVGLAGLPLIVPFIVLGVSLFLLFVFVGVPRSLLTIAIGHTRRGHPVRDAHLPRADARAWTPTSRTRPWTWARPIAPPCAGWSCR